MENIHLRTATNTNTINVPPSVTGGSNVGGAGRRVPLDDIELLQNPRLSRPSSEGPRSRPSSAGSEEPPVMNGRPPIVRDNFFAKENDSGSDISDARPNGFFQQQQRMPPNMGGSMVSGGSSDDDDDDDGSSGYDESLPDNNMPNFGGMPPQQPPPRPQMSMPQQPSMPQSGAAPPKQGGFFSNLFGGFKKPAAAPQAAPSGGDDDAYSESGDSMMGMPSLEMQNQRKQEMLYKLSRLEKAGYMPSRKFTMQNTYEEVKYEFDRLKKQRDADNAIKFSRKMLMAFVSGTEFMNDRFDPFGLQLEGWSEAVMEDLPSYDEVFEELHEKYKTKVQMAPELKLMWMVGSSAFMFHLSNSMFGNAMKGRGGGPMGSLGGMGGMGGGPDMRNMAQNMMRDQMARTMAEEEMAEREAIRRGQQAQAQMPPRREMRGPSGVDDILGNLRNNRMPAPSFQTRSSTPPPPQSDDDDDIMSGDEEAEEIPGERIFNRPSAQIPLRR